MENVCRTCLRSPEKLLPLRDHLHLISKIEAISSIQISENDKYPSTICEECIGNVNKFFNFRKVIINNDKEIRERYATMAKRKFKDKKHNKTQSETKNRLENCDVGNVKLEEYILNDLPQADNLEVEYFDHQNDSDIEENVDGETKGNDNMESIKRTIANMKLCKCNLCNLTFTSRFKLYNHRRTEHIPKGVCNICGLVVRSDNLKRHVQLHSEGPAECKHCGKVFKNSESLRGHMLIHRGIIFTCELCGKTSKVKSEHRRHMATHLDPESRKVKCSLCGKKVRDLRKHMHSHTGERPYTCDFCKKGFTSPYALKVHRRQHTNERPFVCEYCPMAFPQKVSLTTHIKSKHKQQSENT